LNALPSDQEPTPSPGARVAFVTGALEVGGSTTFLCNLGGELVRRGVPVEVLSFERSHPLAADFARVEVPVVLQDDRRLIYEDRLRGILNRLAEFQPATVLANLSAVSFEVLRYVPKGVFRLGVAHTDHPGVYAMLAHYPAYLDLLAVVSPTMLQQFSARPEFAGVPVRYLPLGVPMPADDVLAGRTFEGPLRLLYLGRVDREQKRAHLFPEIFAGLRASGIPFHWTIAGEGGELAALQSALAGGRPDQTVCFPGRIPYAEVPRLIAQHDVFLLASEYEGLPLTLVEAMGAGLVPVVSDLPSGIRELVDDATGRRVAPGDVAGYAAAVVWLHEHRDEMRRLACQARQRVAREFSNEAMARRWLRILPSRPLSGVLWPRAWSIQPPIPAAGQWRFSLAGRLLRRLLRYAGSNRTG
jgi:glycosyltransferase involved in cell wall biosynthesis